MSLFGQKKEKEDVIPPVSDIQTTKPPSRAGQAMRLVLTFLVIVVIALILLIVFIRGSVSSVPIKTVTTPTGPVFATFSLISRGSLQYNDSQSIVEFAKIGYSMSNAQSANAVIDVYSTNPVRKIYLLNVGGYCVQCFVGTSIYNSLNQSLRQYGLILNKSSFHYTDINKIDSIPPESIIIIPSGLVPNILFPNVTYTNLCPKYTNSSIVSLTNQGDILIYIGKNFSRSVTCSGQVVETPPTAMQSILPQFNTTGPVPDYATNTLYLKNATFSFIFGQNYSSSTAVRVGQDGAMVALSNYPSVGWNNSYANLASDIAKIIASRYWMPVMADGSLRIPPNATSSSFTVFSTNLTIQNQPGITSLINSSYTLVQITANNSKSFTVYDIPASSKFKNNGQIGLQSNVGLGQVVQVAAQVFNESNNHVTAFAQIYDQNLTPVGGEVVHFGQLGPLKSFQTTQFNLPSGYYFANLTDQNGVPYSTALFHVANAMINPYVLDFTNASFLFYVQSNGGYVNGIPYIINLNGGYNSSGYTQNGAINYTLPKGTIVSYGQKVFTIRLLDTQYTYAYSYTNPGINIPPLYIEVGVELIIVLLIAKFLVPPNVDDYYIDVPDIRPVVKQVLKENSDAIVDVFVKVNTYYHWRDMPLTVDEIKTGIGNYIKYGNAKVSITARNT